MATAKLSGMAADHLALLAQRLGIITQGHSRKGPVAVRPLGHKRPHVDPIKAGGEIAAHAALGRVHQGGDPAHREAGLAKRRE